MQIIFATSACSKKMYEKIFFLRNKKIIDPAQKFYLQLMCGMQMCLKRPTKRHLNVKVMSISMRPVSASSTNVRRFKRYEENTDGIKYIYPAFYNGKILRFITSFINCFIETRNLLRANKEEKDKIVVCDPLFVHASCAVRIAAKLEQVKSIAIVTDIPVYATEMKQYKYSKIRHVLQRLCERLAMIDLAKYDGYINLTSAMDDIVNVNKKPSIVIEGSVDIDSTMESVPKINEKKKKIVVYAGGIYERYGVKCLVNAFTQANIDNTELHIYGEGTYVEELIEICKHNNSIKYMGCVLNSQLVDIERNSTLLVNPRFSADEYTKFSFPSKILEYMSSGTPVLTTRLAGIPKEYAKCLFWFDEETEAAMAQKLQEVLKLKEAELKKMGENARKFVLTQKNNVQQANKIIQFLKDKIFNR